MRQWVKQFMFMSFLTDSNDWLTSWCMCTVSTNSSISLQSVSQVSKQLEMHNSYTGTIARYLQKWLSTVLLIFWNCCLCLMTIWNIYEAYYTLSFFLTLSLFPSCFTLVNQDKKQNLKFWSCGRKTSKNKFWELTNYC